MRDVADAMPVSKARLMRELDEHECRRRNALSRSIPGFALRSGEGVRMEWDGPNMKSPNVPEAAKFVKREVGEA